MPNFIHTADWQIGRQYNRFPPDDAAALAEARFTTVERIARLATELAVDAVLVAGDVFDAQTVSDRSIRRLFNSLEGFAGPWVLLPGNHDAALAESAWSRAQRLGAVPRNVHLALTPQVLTLEAHGLAVLPAPLMQRHTHDDLSAWFDAADTPPGLLRIGSLKNNHAPIMMKIGPVKPMAVMSASGMRGSATNHRQRPSVCTAPRLNWPPIWVGR